MIPMTIFKDRQHLHIEKRRQIFVKKKPIEMKHISVGKNCFNSLVVSTEFRVKKRFVNHLLFKECPAFKKPASVFIFFKKKI